MRSRVVTAEGGVLKVLRKLVRWADTLHLCYAWATSRAGRAAHWQALDIAKVERAIIGVHFAQTEPFVLEKLADANVLRVVSDPRGVYHPKLLIAVKGHEVCALIGSSNFTAGGFPTKGGNVEINVLLRGTEDDRPLATALAFVDSMWKDPRAFKPSADWLADYRQAHEEEPVRRSVPPPPHTTRQVATLRALDVEWDDYVRLIESQELRALANGWEIRVFDFPEAGSYLEEAEACAAAFRDYGSFARMPLQQRRLVAGWGDETSGYFGKNTGAGGFKSIVKYSPQKLADWLDMLPLDGSIEDSLSQRVLDGLLSQHRIGLGVASRLMCVKRPDLFVVVNNANAPAVRRLFGSRPSTSGAYLKLMERIRRFPWWSTPRPRAPREARIWMARVALLDAVMYDIPSHQL